MNTLPARQSAGATLAEADAWEVDALEAIEHVDDPDAAEALLARIKLAEQAIRLSRLGAERVQRWGRVRLLGERRYGELLGPAENHGPATVTACHGSTDGDRKQAQRAREVAEVPEPEFQEYVQTAELPTRAGLLRKASRTREEPCDQDSEERKDPGPGVRKTKQQSRLLATVWQQADNILMFKDSLDLEVIRTLPEEEKNQCRQSLSEARTVITRILGAL